MKCDRENKKFKIGILNDIVQLKKSFRIKSKKQRVPADIIGYYELKIPQNELVFKIRDKTNQGNDKKKSEIKTGRKCDTFNVDDLKVYIKALKKEPNSDANFKSDFCDQLKQILIDKDTKDKQYRYLYGPEETIEYNLNKKIK